MVMLDAPTTNAVCESFMKTLKNARGADDPVPRVLS
jgi:hypothetical protein